MQECLVIACACVLIPKYSRCVHAGGMLPRCTHMRDADDDEGGGCYDDGDGIDNDGDGVDGDADHNH